MSPLCLFPPTHTANRSDICTTVYALAYKFQLRKSRPTLTHSFVRLIDEKKKLLACFTQNVDALERRAGVPETKLIEAYGSFTTHYCMKCHMEYDHELVMDVVERKGMPMCQPECHAFLRPGIRFFGEDVSTPRFPTLSLTSENF